MDLIEELNWRGLLHDIIPGVQEHLKSKTCIGYVGFDPTAPSLTIGNLAPIMMLIHLQRAGHHPIALLGGATGLIGDPSGKSEERKLLSKELLNENLEKTKKQLTKFLDIGNKYNPARILNNFDWYKNLNVLDFLRDEGKFLTISYMMAKDSVKNRLEGGMSFTEFAYQLMQAYDFSWLYKNHNCSIQMGGSDQWGNITAGVELTRKKMGEPVFGFTCPLITKADGTKFGKTESGNVWLDPSMTSPYKFYQFWLNCSDEDAKKFTRIFTLLPKNEIENLEKEHLQSPHLRILQKALAKDVTIRVHSKQEFLSAINASELLFSNAPDESLSKLSEKELLEIFEGVPQFKISNSIIETGVSIIDLLAEKTKIFPSKAEVRRNIEGISVNKKKLEGVDTIISSKNLLNEKHLLIQRGKKNYFLITVE